MSPPRKSCAACSAVFLDSPRTHCPLCREPLAGAPPKWVTLVPEPGARTWEDLAAELIRAHHQPHAETAEEMRSLLRDTLRGYGLDPDEVNP